MNRDRRLQRALDTIETHGGVVGVTDAAAILGKEGANIDWYVKPWTRIGCGRVYLVADVEQVRDERARAREQREQQKAAS